MKNLRHEESEKKTFSLLCVNGKPETAKFREVDGQWIEIITGMETFIWSDLDEDVEGIHGPFEVFHLVNGESGICIGRGFFEEEAIESARVEMRKRGRNGIEQSIKKSIEWYGISPSFS